MPPKRKPVSAQTEGEAPSSSNAAAGDAKADSVASSSKSSPVKAKPRSAGERPKPASAKAAALAKAAVKMSADSSAPIAKATAVAPTAKSAAAVATTSKAKPGRRNKQKDWLAIFGENGNRASPRRGRSKKQPLEELPLVTRRRKVKAGSQPPKKESTSPLASASSDGLDDTDVSKPKQAKRAEKETAAPDVTEGKPEGKPAEGKSKGKGKGRPPKGVKAKAEKAAAVAKHMTESE